MGLKIGKFLGRVGVGLVKSAPSIAAGFAAGGPLGASVATLGGISFGGGGGPAGISPSSMFAQPSATFPSRGVVGGPVAMPVSQEVTVAGQITREIFELAVKVLDRLKLIPKNPNRVTAVVRRVLSAMIRFARRTPGLQLINMLVSLGLTALEAERLIAWYTSPALKKRRRMRVTNVRALRRSIRRLEGFHRVAVRVESALARRPTVKRIRARIRRCPRCHQDPCRC